MLKYNKSATHRIICAASNLPIKNDVSNLTATSAFFHHVPNYVGIVREICRVTKNKQALLYFDCDDFTPAPSQYHSKFENPSRLLSFFSFVLTKPIELRKLLEYVIYGRRRHKMYLSHINFGLTDGNRFCTERITQFLNQNSFSVEIITYKTGSYIIAKRIRTAT